jgi:hypothetical protein
LELDPANKRVEVLEKEQNTQLDLSKLLASSQKEVKEMQSKVTGLEQASRLNTLAAKETDSLRTQLTATQDSLKEIARDKENLKETIDDLQRSTQEARLSEEKIRKQLQQEPPANRDVVRTLESELQTAKDSGLREAKLAEEAKQAAIDEEHTRHKNEMEVIQKRLDDSEATLKRAAEAADLSRAEEQEEHHKRVAEINDKVAEAERARDAALSDLDILRNELASARAATKPVHHSNREEAATRTDEDGVHKKRRAVNRNHVERAQPTAHGGLAPRKSPTQPAEAATRGPIVPESQYDNFPQSSYTSAVIDSLLKEAEKAPTNASSAQPHARDAQSSRWPEVEESQQLRLESPMLDDMPAGTEVEESQPSGMGAKLADAITHFQAQTDDSYSDLYAVLVPQPNSRSRDMDQVSKGAVGTQTSNGEDYSFAEYNARQQQSQRVIESPVLAGRTERRSPPNQDFRGLASSSLHEPETRVSKKIMPPPNSSSKRVCPGTGDSSRSGGSHGQSFNAKALKTPEPRGFSRNGRMSTSGKPAQSSSSPDFISTQKDGHAAATYSDKPGHRQSGKERSGSNLKRKSFSQSVLDQGPSKSRRASVPTKTGASSQPASKMASQMMSSSQRPSQAAASKNKGASSAGARTPALHRMSSFGNTLTTRRSTRSKKSSQGSSNFDAHEDVADRTPDPKMATMFDENLRR